MICLGRIEKMSIIISDIHGCFNTIQKLLANCPQEDVKNNDIFLLGDLIDRGPRSKEVLEWAIANKVKTVKGNHEDLCLAHYNIKPNCSRDYIYGVWIDFNGGDKTIRSFGGDIPRETLIWMSNLPVYLTDERYPELFLSHTGWGKSADNGNLFHALWERNHDFKNRNITRVIGHTPVKQPFVSERYINIDTGAAYSQHGFGNMTALIWPAKKFVTQKFCD